MKTRIWIAAAVCITIFAAAWADVDTELLVPTDVSLHMGTLKGLTAPRVVDVTEVNPMIGVALLHENRADLVRAEIPLPAGACTSARDCADAVIDTCEIVDPSGNPSGVEVEYNGEAAKCSGRCPNGVMFEIHCVRPK